MILLDSFTLRDSLAGRGQICASFLTLASAISFDRLFSGVRYHMGILHRHQLAVTVTMWERETLKPFHAKNPTRLHNSPEVWFARGGTLFLPQDQIQVIFLKVRAYETRSLHGNIAGRILVTIFILVKTLYQNQYRMTFIDEVMQCESNVIFNSSTKWTNIIQSALKTSALDLGALK